MFESCRAHHECKGAGRSHPLKTPPRESGGGFSFSGTPPPLTVMACAESSRGLSQRRPHVLKIDGFVLPESSRMGYVIPRPARLALGL